MKTRIHVNQHRIKANRKSAKRDPVLTIKDYKQNRYGYTASIVVDGIGEVARVIYSPDNPLSCGAECWIETEYEVIVGSYIEASARIN